MYGEVPCEVDTASLNNEAINKSTKKPTENDIHNDGTYLDIRRSTL